MIGLPYVSLNSALNSYMDYEYLLALPLAVDLAAGYKHDTLIEGGSRAHAVS